ncbi:hypothetical protein KAFR_0F02160 [Kazachstania africana CBS 2517]|uniref:tRNA pseudouridine(32) synthase n=1 Tax=Kazachstania africana (strain ATCC 22294 / BCRC 22015 / CBS 2517 / CECT 1963 / NBRC 1671 / NRRL Y-8276) TaxID=1071382 RepID=H2AWR3_KAZAF|nr:hypothetical protein KAFR_0F02160 [Kazachstania africana CBS 2517]CCF58813.1 hypothetical protein KAFR_0F02160 [Kazachstania africana CBS 2517]
MLKAVTSSRLIFNPIGKVSTWNRTYTRQIMTDKNEFDRHLQEEIRQAKETQDSKNRKRKLETEIKKDKKLRDSNGFKLRLNESKKNGHKQVDPEYNVTIENDLRKIEPYYFTYKTFCKLRWRDRKLLDIFVSEFREHDEAYYKKCIENGSVLIDDKPANIDTIVRNGSLISHKAHRHEPPVIAKPIKIVYQDDDLLVIDKPSGIPVHPTGRYRFNSVTKMLEKQLGFAVHPCNRLDKLTSGLMFLAKTPKGADEMGDQLKVREVRKEYIARVVGEFPVEEISVDMPLRTFDPKVALNVVCSMEDEGARHAKTIFKRISFDGRTSVVRCKPLTGRQHQIRVHLQYLGFPIANDPIYSSPYIWGPSLGKEGKAVYNDIAEKLHEIGKTRPSQSWYFSNLKGEILQTEKCIECGVELHRDPDPNELTLWLHALRYESTTFDSVGQKKWKYRTDFPDWALESHCKYMEMAIKEADKCAPTTTAFSVGAVIVSGTEVLSTGYSRELPGNTHAEQCALEKYFEQTGKRELPAGSIIYTTMEPCSYRLSGNEPCVQRILNLNGQISCVFVGVIEPDTFVKNNTSVSLLEERNIDYIQIPGYEEQCTKIAFRGHEEDMKEAV